MKPRLLDAFSGPGGAGVGYARAGFDVVGVDIEPWACYPFEQIAGDALAYIAAHGHEFDAIHASPPCHAYSAISEAVAAGHFSVIERYPDLYAPTVTALKKVGVPWIVENVPGAPGSFGIQLCGSMFGLTAKRHRLFEFGGWDGPFMAPFSCDHTDSLPWSPYNSATYTAFGLDQPAATRAFLDAMGCDWIGERDHYNRSSGYLEAIPPAFTEWIGTRLLAALAMAA